MSWCIGGGGGGGNFNVVRYPCERLGDLSQTQAMMEFFRIHF
jgi:hypothetical protein